MEMVYDKRIDIYNITPRNEYRKIVRMINKASDKIRNGRGVVFRMEFDDPKSVVLKKIGEERLSYVEDRMKERGYIPSKKNVDDDYIEIIYA